MKKIYKTIGAIALISVAIINLATGTTSIVAPTDLSLENLDALGASAGFWECDGSSKSPCSISNGSVTGNSTGNLIHFD